MNDLENIYKLLPVKLAADWDFALINKAEGRALMQLQLPGRLAAEKQRV